MRGLVNSFLVICLHFVNHNTRKKKFCFYKMFASVQSSASSVNRGKICDNF